MPIYHQLDSNINILRNLLYQITTGSSIQTFYQVLHFKGKKKKFALSGSQLVTSILRESQAMFSRLWVQARECLAGLQGG